MSRDKVSHEQEDAHDYMLGYRDNVGTRNLGNSDSTFIGGIQIDVIGTDTSGYTEFQVLCLLQDFLREVTGVKRSGNENFGLQIRIELAMRSLDHESKIHIHPQSPSGIYCLGLLCRR